MFSYLEKFFPDLIERIRRLPATVKVVIAVVLALSPIVASRAPAIFAAISSLLDRQYSLSGSVVFIGALALLMVVPAAHYIAAIHRPRSTLVSFCREWTRFSSHFFLLYVRIEVYLLRDKSSGFDSREWREIEPMLPEYWRLRGRLRKLLFLVDEGSLMIQRVPAWEDLRRKNPVLPENEYRTPFSFLLNVGNPIAAVNLDGQTVWAALHIAAEYLELLSYKHRAVQRAIAEARKPAMANIEQAKLSHGWASV
jgi:hypothetical protein